MSFMIVSLFIKLIAKLYLYFRLSKTSISFFTNKLFITLYNVLVFKHLNT